MTVAFIPGFSREATTLKAWASLLPDQDVRLFNLPDHSLEPTMAEPSLEKLADLYAARLPTDALVVGESLGGLVALQMARLGFRVVAVDPPLSTQKLWVLHRVLGHIIRDHPQATWLPDFVDTFFGVAADGAITRRHYWPLLDALTAPVDIVAATLPLWPVRVIPFGLKATPSMLDEDDAYRLARHPNVRFHQVEGPHSLLTEAAEPMRALLLEILARPPAGA